MSNKNLNYIAIAIFILTTIVLCYYLFVHIPYEREQEKIERTKKEEILRKEKITVCKKEVEEKSKKKWQHACEERKKYRESLVESCIEKIQDTIIHEKIKILLRGIVTILLYIKWMKIECACWV